jgi:hypothetical protein
MEETDQIAYLVFYLHQGEPARAVADEGGSLLGFDLEETAFLYAARLASYEGIAASVQPMTPANVVEFLTKSGVALEDAAEHYNMFEAQTTDEQDLERWCVEHADRYARRLGAA